MKNILILLFLLTSCTKTIENSIENYYGVDVDYAIKTINNERIVSNVSTLIYNENMSKFAYDFCVKYSNDHILSTIPDGFFLNCLPDTKSYNEYIKKKSPYFMNSNYKNIGFAFANGYGAVFIN